MNDVTFMIKTIERPDCLARLVRGIRFAYDNVPIIVADDGKDTEPSRKVCTAFNAQHVPLMHDVGLSAGRNAMADLVETDYLCTMDDDFVFTPATDIQRLLSLAKSTIFDLVTGTVLQMGTETHFEGRLWIQDRTMHLRPLRAKIGKPIPIDIGWNFFVAETAKVRRVRWDDQLKICEHHDFFLRWRSAGYTCGYHPKVVIDHRPDSTPAYAAYRHARNHEYWSVLQAKHDFVDVNGSLY
jgi:glycosyltransferase involved in cell wall biosynthesis